MRWEVAQTTGWEDPSVAQWGEGGECVCNNPDP